MWYVLQVKDGMDDELLPDIRKILLPVADCTVFSPKCIRAMKLRGEWNMMKKELFPGYVFVSTEHADDVLKQLQIIVSGVSPVCIGGGFNPIRQDEQDFLESMMNAGHEIEYSGGNIIDGKLIVDYGPLKDKTQFVRRIDRHHRTAGVAVRLWGMEQCVKVGLEVRQKS